MKIKCNDGVVRRFSPCKKAEVYDGRVFHECTEAYCDECFESFGRHDLNILKPLFLNHICEEKLL